MNRTCDENIKKSPNKLPKHLDNPIDRWIIDQCEKMDPLFVKWNMTPNKLTTIGFYFGLLSVYCLHKRIKYLPGIFYFISYMFDCADGQFARRHNMVSKFGDYYDSFKDWSIALALLYILYKRKNKYLILIVIVGIMSLSHFGCQEIYYNSKNPDKKYYSEKNALLECLCPKNKDVDEVMLYTKHFGIGTLTLIISFILFFE